MHCLDEKRPPSLSLQQKYHDSGNPPWLQNERKKPRKRRSCILENDPLQLPRPEQTAAIFCVSRSTVDRLVNTDRLPSVRLTAGKRKTSYGIRRSTLEKWIATHERPSKAE